MRINLAQFPRLWKAHLGIVYIHGREITEECGKKLLAINIVGKLGAARSQRLFVPLEQLNPKCPKRSLMTVIEGAVKGSAPTWRRSSS